MNLLCILNCKDFLRAVSELETAISSYNLLSVAPIWAVAENYRFEPAFVEGRKLLMEVGDIINVHAIIEGSMNISNPYFSSSWRRSFDVTMTSCINSFSLYLGGFILDMGVHFIAGLRMFENLRYISEDHIQVAFTLSITNNVHMAIYLDLISFVLYVKNLLGEISVSALTSHVDGTLPAPDHISSTIQLENGSYGVFVMVVSSKSPKVLWRVVGLKGTMQVERGDMDGKHGYTVMLYMGDGGNKSWFYPFSGVNDELKTFLADISLAGRIKDTNLSTDFLFSKVLEMLLF